MSLTTGAPRALPSVLRIAAGDLAAASAAPAAGASAAPATPARYRALLAGPAGSGIARAVALAGDAPHDLVVVEYGGEDGYARAWLRGETCADGVVYTLLAEMPASFPSWMPAIAR
jgi:hypothetical protein